MSSKYFHYTPEVDEWLKARASVRIAELYPAFIATFPAYKDITEKTLQYHRYDIKASKVHGKGTGLPLYTERVKKGQLKIKVAEPNVWINKSKWVYEETHPELAGTYSAQDVFIFLDDDKMNYKPENILRISKSVCMVCNRHGGLVGLSPDEKKLLIARAKLRLASYDAGEKCGLVYSKDGNRYFKSEAKEKQRAYRAAHKDDPDYIEKRRLYDKRCYKNMTPEQKAALLSYQREYRKQRSSDPAYIEKIRRQRRESYARRTPEQREHYNELQRKYRAERKAERAADDSDTSNL